MPICPHCENEIERLNFQQDISGYEDGRESFPLGNGNRDYGDQEITDSGDITYTCPECDEEISTEERQRMNEIYIAEHTTTQTPENRFIDPFLAHRIPEIIPTPDQSNTINAGTNHHRFHPEQTGHGAHECPHCHHIYEDEYNEEMICPRCEQTWTQEPFQNSIIQI